MKTPKRQVLVRAWIIRHQKLLKITAGVFVAAVIGVQLWYPQKQGLPFARLAGESVARVPHNDIAASIQKKFLGANVELKAGSKTEKISLIKTGATPNTDRMVERLTDYPLWQRLVPFSLLVKQPNVETLDVYFDQPQLEKAATELAKKLLKPAEDARLAIEKGELVVTDARPGASVDEKEVMSQLSTAKFAFGQSDIALSTKKIEPKRSDGDIAPVRQQAETAIARKISISGPAGQTFEPDAHMIASWLTIQTLENGSVQLTIDDGRVAAYVEDLNNKVKTDPGVTNVNLLDGQETARQDGSQGQEIVTSELIDGLKHAVMDQAASRELTIKMQPVASAIVNNRRYSSSQKGLQAYVDYVTSIQDVHISLTQLDGERWVANGRAGDSMPSASTYKLFVSLVLFDKINKGEIHWGDSMLDTTVEGCFERTIVPSTNPCAESWIAQFGRQYINDFAYARGFSQATSFTAHPANHTSAADLAKYMIGLNDGTLVSGTNRDILLEKMGRQLYRYGIPTGTAGWAQDKVGFLWDYVHDAAIVHHPKGTYVVAIMTRGQSYARIAQITRELERIMYP
ncbi:MAG TPA: serine hydrolase [Candidatus Saccharimonadales bacterium]